MYSEWKAEMENTARPDAVVGLQPETMEGRAPTRGRLTSAIAATLHFLVHPLAREMVGADAETGRPSRPERTPHASRSGMDAGITGGFSLLMDHPPPRHRR
jgi:hypothetical protein